MTRTRIDRILTIGIGLVAGIIIGILLMVAISGCVPGGSAAACPPARPHAGITVAVPLVEGSNEAPAGQPSTPSEGPGGPHFGTRSAEAPVLLRATPPGEPVAPGKTDSVQPGGGAGTGTRALTFSPAVRRALDLLRLHESVDGTQMVGDGGRARGWLQQHEGHWNDGCEVLGVAWKWPEDTRDLAKCEMVAVGNWMRYAQVHLEAGNIEELVRRFRLPFDPYRADNAAYWAKVMMAKGELR